MNPLLDEIEDYLNNSNLVNRTKSRYRQQLNFFAQYLAKLLDEPINTVNLSKIYYIPYENQIDKYIFLQIDVPILDEFFEVHLSKGYSWLAVTKSALSGLFKHLCTCYDFHNALYGIEFQLAVHKPEPKQQRVLNRHEILKLMMSILKHSSSVDRDSLLFVILLSTGCRIGEVLNLRWKDIIAENDLFFLSRTKNKRSKYVATKFGLTKAIEIYCIRNNKKINDYIFMSKNNNKPISQNEVRELFHFYLNKASIPLARVHDTRRSFATVMYENGTDIDIIRQLINHEDINSTKEYIEDHYIRNESIHIPIYDSLFREMRNRRLGSS